MKTWKETAEKLADILGRAMTDALLEHDEGIPIPGWYDEAGAALEACASLSEDGQELVGTNLADPNEFVELKSTDTESAAHELLEKLGWAVTK